MKTEDVRLGEAVSLNKEGVSRRGFVGGMGAMMAAAALACSNRSRALADEATGADEVEEAGAEEVVEATAAVVESVTGWTGTPEEVLALGVSTMPLEDLNNYRQAYIDAQTDYTCEDGTVVPAVYAKMRALVHSYGMGCGREPIDANFTTLMELFTEEDVEGYLQMPMGVEFTAYEFHEKSGYDYETAKELCDKFAENGYLCAYDSNRGRLYHQVAYFQGAAEYTYTRGYDSLMEDYTAVVSDPGCMSDITPDMMDTGTPTFYYVPVDESVVDTGTILPFDDLKAKILSQDLVCVTPCPCRYIAILTALGPEGVPTFDDFKTGEYRDYFSPLCDQRVETCIQAGDEAAYWIEQGWGRQISPETAVEYLEQSVEDGFMLETTFGKTSDTICSCHADSCGIIGMWNAIGDGDAIAATDAFKQVSHYTLEVDPDKCIACGLCVDRCPLHIISINDEGWAEPAANCFRCGQCAYVCPQGARVLVERDESELAPLPQDMVEDANVKAAYRFETGLITW